MSESYTIAPLAGAGRTIILGDDGVTDPKTSIISPPLPVPEITVQTVMPVRAKYAVTYARGNALAPYTWEVVRTHSSVRAAVTFARDHVKEIMAACALGQFVLRRTAFGVTMSSVGALRSPRCTQLMGVRTRFQYVWQGTPFE